MKKITLLFLIIAINICAQQNIPLMNQDIEATTAMATDPSNGDKWSIEGFFVNEDSPNIFDAANSGLAPGMGRNNSQAFKLGIINSTGKAPNVAFSKRNISISNYGIGTYKFTFYAKSTTIPAARPFWCVVTAYDEDDTNLTNVAGVVEKIDNGGTIVWAGMDIAYTEQSISVKIGENLTNGGKNAVKLQLSIQSAKFNNTYYLDDFSLTFTAEPTTGIEEFDTENYKVFPSPFNDELNVSALKGVGFDIFNTTGVLVYSAKKEHTNVVNTSTFTPGVYMLKTTNGKSIQLTK